MNTQNSWGQILSAPLKNRLDKPRSHGLTMVLDKGLGLNQLREMMETGGSYIDIVKFSFGSSFILPSSILNSKINYLRQQNIQVYPGGTLFEIAASQHNIEGFLTRAKQLGFTAIEISDGTLKMSPAKREKAILRARALGFKVFTEVGKKDKKAQPKARELIQQAREDLENGAFMVIIEGRESGKGISIYNNEGDINEQIFEKILGSLNSYNHQLLWEAPLKKQQVKLIKKLGPNVNLGNINYQEIIALETLRQGLRGDTFASQLDKKDRIIGA